MTQLFRAAALEHQRSRLEGELVISQPVSHWALLALLLCLVAGGSTYLAWGTYSKKQVVRGYLLPDNGVVKVFAPPGSTIVAAHVDEGHLVEQGELLYTLSKGTLDARGQRLDNQLVAALEEQRGILESELKRVSTRRELARQRLDTRARQLQDERVQLRSLLAARAERLALSEQALKAAEDMSREAPGLVTLDELRRHRAQRLEETLELLQTQLALSSKQADLENLELEAGALSVEAEGDRARLHRSLSELGAQGTRESSERAFTLVAPVAGRVTAVQAAVGQFTASPAPLCVLVPRGGRLRARAYVPARAAGWVEPGQEVRLMYDAFPHEHYGVQSATVASVAEVVLQPGEVDSPIALQEPVYAASLDLSSDALLALGKEHALHSGMLFTGQVVLERRSLWRWLLRPLYALQAP